MFKARFFSATLCVALCACASAPAVVVRPPAPQQPPVTPARVFARAEVVRAIDSLVAQPLFRTANWGVLVVHPASGDTLYSHDAAKLFVPASNTKLVTGATALVKLGGDFRWRTIVAARGALTNGTLDGDLIIAGRGDPTISSRLRTDAMLPLGEIADSIAARGIRRIRGRLLQGGNAFSDSRIGAGWQWDYLSDGYAAGVDALFFNEGLVDVRVRGGVAAGDPVEVVTAPARTYPVVKVSAMTHAAAAGPARIRLTLDSLTGEVTISGSAPPGDTSFSRTLTLTDPATAYLHALREALGTRGIVVDSPLTAGARAAAADMPDTLFVYRSAPLSEVLGEMMKPSQNQLAEIFLKTIGLEVTGAGRADSGLRVVRDLLREWNVEADGFALRDGSGLTRNNFISPESIARLLHAMRKHPDYRTYFESLPIAGVDGTLRSRMRNTPAQGNLRAKTGTLARASAMSGYVTTSDGEELIFSIFCNNFTAAASAVTGMQNEIGVMLASLRWKN